MPFVLLHQAPVSLPPTGESFTMRREMVMRSLVPLIVGCALVAGCGGKTSSPGTTKAQTTTVRKPSGGFTTATAQFAGMNCGTIGLHGGAAIGRYVLYVCAGPDNAKLNVPSGAYVCWGFHDFGKGYEQPAVGLNLMNGDGRTIGGHVYPDTSVNCRLTLRAVAGVL